MIRSAVVAAAFLMLWTAQSTQGQTSYSHLGDTDGVYLWPKLFPTCAGTRQSPVSIYDRKSVFLTMKLQLYNYDAQLTHAATNNGHTVVVRGSGSAVPSFTGTYLSDWYDLDSYHFHWGADSTRGSEHWFEGREFPLEMHLVHYKRSLGSVVSGAAASDGLAVLGVMFHLAQVDNPKFTALFNAIDQLSAKDTTATAAVTFSMWSLLPSDTWRFYRYLGSLTTPTCNEAVIWTVFKTTVPISDNQLTKLRALKDGGNATLVDNFRPPQVLHDRDVYKSFLF